MIIGYVNTACSCGEKCNEIFQDQLTCFIIKSEIEKHSTQILFGRKIGQRHSSMFQYCIGRLSVHERYRVFRTCRHHRCTADRWLQQPNKRCGPSASRIGIVSWVPGMYCCTRSSTKMLLFQERCVRPPKRCSDS